MNLGFDVVELGDPDAPEAGDEAPEFTRPLVTDEYWTDTSLSELTDRGPVVLVFHTMDGDFPATYVWQAIDDRGWNAYDAAVVGVSISTPYEHSRFLEEWGLEGFRLFSDPANEVAERYGIGHDLDGMAGVSPPSSTVARSRTSAAISSTRRALGRPLRFALVAVIGPHRRVRSRERSWSGTRIPTRSLPATSTSGTLSVRSSNTVTGPGRNASQKARSRSETRVYSSTTATSGSAIETGFARGRRFASKTRSTASASSASAASPYTVSVG